MSTQSTLNSLISLKNHIRMLSVRLSKNLNLIEILKSATTQLATSVADFNPQDGLCPSEGITKALLPVAKAAQRAVAFLAMQMCRNEGEALFEARVVTSLVGTPVPLLQEMQAFSAPQKSNADSQRLAFA